MGFCFSSCRRRRAEGDREEHRPLLRSNTESLAVPDSERSPYEKIADVLAALNAGKMPSEVQVGGALRRMLGSGVLDPDSTARERLDSAYGYGGTSTSSTDRAKSAMDEMERKVVGDVRWVVEVVLEIGEEKNGDDRLQDLVYQVHQLSSKAVPVNVKSLPEVELNVNEEAAERVQTAASAIPSQNELASDTIALISSLRTLAVLFLTSSAFRLILGDLLITARQFVASTAEQVRRAAETVERVSEAVEINVMPRDSQGAEVRQNGTEMNPPPRTVNLEEVNQEIKSPKDVVLDRIEDVFRQAQASPQYNSALRTLLYIFRKYAERVQIASAAISEDSHTSSEESFVKVSAPVIVPDPRFSRALEDVKILLERFANGKSLDSVLQALFKTVHDVSVTHGGNDDAQAFFREVGSWLDKALASPSFVNSRAGRDAASRLYDEASTQLSQNGQLIENVRNLSYETDAFIDACRSDKLTNRLLDALDALHSDVIAFFSQTAQSSRRTASHWRTALLRAALGWVLPRLLRVIHTLPMPRVEYVSLTSTGTRIAGAIDALLLSAEEALVPDVLSVQEFTEVRVEVDERVGAVELTNPNARLLDHDVRKDAAGVLQDTLLRNGRSSGEHSRERIRTSTGPGRRMTNVIASSRVKVHIEGLRVAAHDVGYYASYARNSWLGYADEGLLSVDIGRGRRRGEGLAMDIELEMNSDDANNGDGDASEKLFRVLDVSTAIPGLALHIAHSRHWILNSVFLAPLAGPIGRAIGTRVLNAQIRGALEKLEMTMRDVKGVADEKARRRAEAEAETGVRDVVGDGSAVTQVETETSVADWWDAVLEQFGRAEPDQNQDEEGDEDEQDVYTETHTEASLTGIVRTSISQPEPEPSASSLTSSSASPSAPPTIENTLAIGLGAQLLPGKAEPTSLGLERSSPQDLAHETAGAAREAIEDVQGKVQDVREGVQDAAQKGIEEAVRMRRMAESAEERMGRQESRERRRSGWRSQAFDL